MGGEDNTKVFVTGAGLSENQGIINVAYAPDPDTANTAYLSIVNGLSNYNTINMNSTGSLGKTEIKRTILNYGTIDGNGSSRNHIESVNQLSGGTINGISMINLDMGSGTNFSSITASTTTNVIASSGTTTYSGSGLNSSSSLTIASGATLNLQTGTYTPGSAATNNGTILLSGGNLGNSVTNNSLIEVTSSSISGISGSISGGEIQLDSGYTRDISAIASGTINIATLDVDGTMYIDKNTSATTTDVSGNLYINTGSTLTGNVSNSGYTIVNGNVLGTLTNNSNGQIDINNSVTSLVNNSTRSDNTISGGTISSIENNENVTVDGSTTFTSTDNNGTLTLASGGTVNATNSIDNDGIIRMSNGSVVGSIDNSNGILDISSNSGSVSGSVTNGEIDINNGVSRTSSGLVGGTINVTLLDNNGTFTVDKDIRASSTDNDGTLNVNADKNLYGSVANAGGTINLSGNISGDVTDNGSSRSGSVYVQNSNASIGGNLTTAYLDIAAGVTQQTSSMVVGYMDTDRMQNWGNFTQDENASIGLLQNRNMYSITGGSTTLLGDVTNYNNMYLNGSITGNVLNNNMLNINGNSTVTGLLTNTGNLVVDSRLLAKSGVVSSGNVTVRADIDTEGNSVELNNNGAINFLDDANIDSVAMNSSNSEIRAESGIGSAYVEVLEISKDLTLNRVSNVGVADLNISNGAIVTSSSTTDGLSNIDRDLNISSNSRLIVANDQNDFNVGGSINNFGSVYVESNKELDVSSNVDNNGTFDISGFLDIRGDLTNSHQISGGGTLTAGSITNDSILSSIDLTGDVQSNGIISNAGLISIGDDENDSDLVSLGNIQNTGTITVYGQTIARDGGTYKTITNNGGTINLKGGVDAGSISNAGDGDVTIGGGNVRLGTIENNTSGSFTIANTSTNTTVVGDIKNTTGTMYLLSNVNAEGNLSNGGTLYAGTSGASINLTLSGSSSAGNGTLTNNIGAVADLNFATLNGKFINLSSEMAGATEGANQLKGTVTGLFSNDGALTIDDTLNAQSGILNTGSLYVRGNINTNNTASTPVAQGVTNTDGLISFVGNNSIDYVKMGSSGTIFGFGSTVGERGNISVLDITGSRTLNDSISADISTLNIKGNSVVVTSNTGISDTTEKAVDTLNIENGSTLKVANNFVADATTNNGTLEVVSGTLTSTIGNTNVINLTGGVINGKVNTNYGESVPVTYTTNGTINFLDSNSYVVGGISANQVVLGNGTDKNVTLYANSSTTSAQNALAEIVIANDLTIETGSNLIATVAAAGDNISSSVVQIASDITNKGTFTVNPHAFTTLYNLDRTLETLANQNATLNVSGFLKLGGVNNSNSTLNISGVLIAENGNITDSSKNSTINITATSGVYDDFFAELYPMIVADRLQIGTLNVSADNSMTRVIEEDAIKDITKLNILSSEFTMDSAANLTLTDLNVGTIGDAADAARFNLRDNISINGNVKVGNDSYMNLTSKQLDSNNVYVDGTSKLAVIFTGTSNSAQGTSGRFDSDNTILNFQDGAVIETTFNVGAKSGRYVLAKELANSSQSLVFTNHNIFYDIVGDETTMVVDKKGFNALNSILAARSGDGNNTRTALAWTQSDLGNNSLQQELYALGASGSGDKITQLNEALSKLAPTESQVSRGVTQSVNSQIGSITSTRLEGRNGGDTITGRGLWAQGLYNHAKQDNTGFNSGFTSNTNGLVLGIDVELDEKGYHSWYWLCV